MKITIDDDINGFLSFDLRDILILIPNAKSYEWFLTEVNFNYLEPTLNLSEISQDDYLFCENAVSMNCERIEYTVLERIANSNIQIIDGIIIGKAKNRTITIKIFDSSYWTLDTEDFEILNNIKKRFPGNNK